MVQMTTCEAISSTQIVCMLYSKIIQKLQFLIKNIVSAWFDSEKAAIQKIKGDKLQEYRLAIYPEVLDFRKQFWHSGCNDCKVNFSDLDSPVPHVDHCGDKEFRHIVADFEIQCEEKNFIEFHRSLAKYQLLCEDCHHKKSKRW